MIIILPMHRLRVPAYYLLITFLLLTSCDSTPTPPPQTSLVVYRYDPPAFIEYSTDFQPVHEIPFAIPPSCGLYNTFPATMGEILLIELSCPNGQTVLFLDTTTGSSTQPVTDSDAHFLAWARDGESAYLRVDSLGNPRVILANVGGGEDQVPITEYTYDLAVNPVNDDFTFTFSRGLGYGSELWLAKRGGNVVELLFADQFNYVSFARFSPDGRRIAFIKIPDTTTPFTVGELWVMNADGSNAHNLADVDAGHGYAANWSPDGKRIAYVIRENLEDESANLSSAELISNIFIVNVETSALKRVTQFVNGHAETPVWSADGNTLIFTAVVDGSMTVFIADVATAGVGLPEPTGLKFPVEMTPLMNESTCCPAWLRR
ncbi:MAG: hypothetical protein AB1607_16570 [Chloroflexota bacterium]